MRNINRLNPMLTNLLLIACLAFGVANAATTDSLPAIISLLLDDESAILVTAEFSPSSVEPGEDTTLTITVANQTDSPFSSISINNVLPSGLLLDQAGSSNTCDLSPDISAESGYYNLTNAELQANGECVVVIAVTGIGIIDVGSKSFSTSNVSDGIQNFPGANATLTVNPADPSVTAEFSPNEIEVNQTSVLTVTLNNANPVALENISINNELPAGLTINTTSSSNTCDASPDVSAANGRYNLTNTTLPANGTCTVTMAITGVDAADVGSKQFSTTNFTNGSRIYGNAIDTLLVRHQSPSLVGGFTQSSVFIGENSSLSYTITNNAPIDLTGVNFNNDLPPQLNLLTGLSSTSCDPSPSISGSQDRFNITNATIPANSSCDITIAFTATTLGSFNTVVSSLTGSEFTAVSPPTISPVNILPQPPIRITGGFDQTSLVVGQAGSISYLIKNNEPFSITGVNFSTNLPIELDLDTVNSSTTCDPSPNASPAVDRFDITDATLAPNSSCTIIVRFTTNAVGTAGVGSAHDFGIILSTVTSNEAASTPAPDIGVLTIQTPAAPTITGSFTPSTLVVGQSGALIYTLSNIASVPLTGVNFSTNLPIELDLDTVDSSSTCDPSPNASPAVDRFDITDATLAPNSSCTIIVRFTTNAVGTAGVGSEHDFGIILSTVTSNEAASTPAPDIGVLTIQTPASPTIIGSFNVAKPNVGDTVTLSYTITNNAPVELTMLDFSTQLPEPLEINSGNSNTSCDSSPLVNTSSGQFFITNGTINANSTCTINIVFVPVRKGVAGVGNVNGVDYEIFLSNLNSAETVTTRAPNIGLLTIVEP